MLKYWYFYFMCFMSTVSMQAAQVWSFLDKTGAEITCQWIEKGNLEEERQVFINAFSEAYKDFSLESLKINNLSEFLNAAFDDEVKDLHSNQIKIYALSVKKEEKVIGFAAFNKTSIEGQIYIRQMAVEPSLWRRGIGTKMLLSIFKAVPHANHLVLATRRINMCARNFYTSLGFTECMYTHEGLSAERYIGLEFSVPSNVCFDDKNLSLREIPVSEKQINWQQVNK